MQVTIDDQVFVLQVRGGISRYFTELIRIFRNDPEFGVEPLTPFRFVVNEHLLDLDRHRFRRAALPGLAQRNRVLQPLNRARIRHRPEHGGLVHHTYYLRSGLRAPAHRRVCTIYDMTPELFPDLFPHGSPHAAKDEYVAACDAILCISNSTKSDLLAHYGSLDKPVVVTPLGVGEEYFVSAPVIGAEVPYVLYVGQRAGYKNFDVVLRAFARLAARTQPLQLRCVGGPPFDDEDRTRIADLGLSAQVTRSTVRDGAMPDVYAGAVCLVFPSRYEGFGLPIIEAFAAGCPVVLADTPGSVEVGDAAAQFFDPDDDDRLAEIVEAFAEDPTTRVRWADAGRSRARDFTWEHTARLTRDVYRDVARALPR